LTYPGIGEDKYIEMAEPLFTLLEYLLPKDEPAVKQTLTLLSGKQNDGFLLLRKIMGKSIPVFCPYKSSKPPTWRKHPDIAEMAKYWTTHFRLMSKSGTVESSVQQSLKFIQSLTEPSLVARLSSIQGQIQAITEGHDDFDTSNIKLPGHLSIDGITNTLTTLPSPMESSIAFARSNNFAYDSSDSDSEIGLQGYSSNATNSRGDRSRSTGPRRRESKNDESKSKSKKDIICRGCHKKGHVEVDCRELARWIIISGAVKKLQENTRKKVLDNYHRFYSTAQPSASISKSCTNQLRQFCNSRSITEQQVVDGFNWDGYVASDEDEEGFATAEEGDDASE
jgi:hypothetical protein